MSVRTLAKLTRYSLIIGAVLMSCAALVQAKGVDAAFINSSLSREQRESGYREVGEGRFQLLSADKFIVCNQPIYLLCSVAYR